MRIRPLTRLVATLALPALAPLPTLGAQARAAAPAAPATPTAAVNVDWRILAGLDYENGRASDTLRKLDGKLVRVPGFVVPLDDAMEEGAEFLLVPYYGACVHTPPPPPNQIVQVKMVNQKKVKMSFWDPVWVHGKLQIATVKSPYGDVGFQLTGTVIEPYKDE